MERASKGKGGRCEWTERDHERYGQPGSCGWGNEHQFHENVAALD